MSLTSFERVMTVISGGIPDRVPTDLHNFLPAAKAAGMKLSECFRSGELMAESQILARRRFGHDMLLVENGTAALAEAMGCGVIYPDDTAPLAVEPALRDLKDIDRLRPVDPEKDFPLTEVVKAVAILRREFGDRVFVMGRADQGPMSLAAMLRGHGQFFMDIAEESNAPLIGRLMDICSESGLRYAMALRAAGAHGTSLGELGSDTISPAMYRRFTVPRLSRFYGAMREADFPASLHQCGNTVAVLDDMTATGAAILELDPGDKPAAGEREDPRPGGGPGDGRSGQRARTGHAGACFRQVPGGDRGPGARRRLHPGTRLRPDPRDARGERHGHARGGGEVRPLQPRRQLEARLSRSGSRRGPEAGPPPSGKPSAG